ncbi:MAG: tetratricopeptide repeat protein [Chitinispirillales bacterium]|jgi:tetratricopeptide (TPR) repeat protein|nr:tetratricopeptide repeat protein [Chitinispirillales bacterium]
MKKEIAVCFAALCCAAVFTSAAAEPKPGLAVYVTGDKTENEKKTLANDITNSFVKSGQYTVAERSDEFLAALAKERGTQRVPIPISDARIIEAAKEYGVEQLCMTDIAGVLGTFYVSLRVIDIETGEVGAVGSAYSNLQRPEDFASVSDNAVGAVFTIALPVAPKKPAPAPAIEEVTPVPPPAEPPVPAPAPIPAPIPAPDLPEVTPAVDASFYYNQGNANVQSNDHDGAIANYTEALKLDPRLIYALIARGAAYYSKGDYQSAVDDYSRTLELEPNDAGVFNSRGNAYRQMGNYEMAIADYEAALRIDPNNAEARESLELIKLDKSGEEKPEHTITFSGLLADMLNMPKGEVRYGVIVSIAPQLLKVSGNAYDNHLSHSDYSGVSVPFGLALSIPITGWLTAETEFKYTYRSLDTYWGSFHSKTYIDESAINVPFLARVTVPWRNLGFYIESGFQLEFPFGTEFSVENSDSKPVSINDRGIELQYVLGWGVSFEYKAKWNVGYRVVPSCSDFGGNYGWLFQQELYCSLTFPGVLPSFLTQR